MITVPEINPDVMHLGLSRQRSLLSNLPDFTSLLESLNTPTLKAGGFDFSADLQLEAEQALSEQFNFENIDTSASLYPESQNPMIAQLKNIQMIEVSHPTSTQSMYSNSTSQQLHYQPPSPDSSLSPAPSPSSGYSSDVNSSSTNMGIDNETENNRLEVIQDSFQITNLKTEPVPRDYSDQKAMEELTKKMDRCCNQLNIQRDPTLWSNHQVQQWAVWISRECYNFDYTPLHQLHVDGTTLCMLKQEDFVMKIGNEQLGQLLFIELEIWRNALCIETETRNQQAIAEIQRQQQQHQLMQQHQMMMQHQQPQHQQSLAYNGRDDPRVYTDLSNATPSSYTITDIPTPVLSPPSSHMTPHDMTLTLNEINQTLTHEMYNTSQNCATYQQISPSSNLGSTGAGWEESSDSSSNFSQDYVMADEDNSRASTPSHPIISGTSSRTIKRGPVAGATTHKKYGAAVGHTKHTIHLWQFLRELLMSPNLYNNCIRWVDQRKGIFKIEDSTRVARLWGQRKNRPAMNYDKLSRSIRQYYKKGIIKKTEQSKRLVYQFCEPYL